MASSSEWKRIVLWAFWTANLLVDVLFILLAWVTASNLANASGNLHIVSWADAKTSALKFVSNNLWRAPISACALGGLMTTLFNLMSCAVLVRKSIVRNGAGFGLGFITAWAFVMAFFTFLVGLVLEGFTSTVEAQLTGDAGWSGTKTGAFKATYGLAYVVSAGFVLMFTLLLVLQGAVARELGVYDQMKQEKRVLEMNALDAAADPRYGVGSAPLSPAPV